MKTNSEIMNIDMEEVTEAYAKGSNAVKVARYATEIKKLKLRRNKRENLIAGIGFALSMIIALLNVFYAWLTYYNWSTILITANAVVLIITAVASLINRYKFNKQIIACREKRDLYMTKFNK